jgi:hypothetical protein
MNHNVQDLVLENRVVAFCQFMAYVRNNLCGKHVSFAFPSNGVYHDITRERLDDFVTALRLNATISYLTLITEVYQETDDDFGELWDAVGKAFNCITNLKEVTFEQTERWDTDAVSRIIKSQTNLEKININFTTVHHNMPRLNQEESELLATSFSNLDHLSVLILSDLPTESSTAFLLGLCEIRNLQHASVSFVPSDIQPLFGSLRGLFQSQSLKSLDLSRFNLDDTSSEIFAKSIEGGRAPKLLQLQECHFGNPETIFSALKRNYGLKELQLDYREMDKRMIQGLGECLRDNLTLEKLDLVLPRPNENLSSTDHPAGSSSRIGRLFDFLKETNSSHLSALSFTSIPLATDDLLSLGSALSQNSSLLAHLDIHGDFSNITADSFNAFAANVAANRHLKEFNLSGFPVLPLTNEEHGERFLEEMSKNVTLEQFTLSMATKEPPRWFQELQCLLTLNQAGRRYILDESLSNDSYQCAEVLGAVSDDLSCIYLHLRQHPSFCSATSS